MFFTQSEGEGHEQEWMMTDEDGRQKPEGLPQKDFDLDCSAAPFHHQKMDCSVLVVRSSRAFMPMTELPFLLSRGLHTATA